MLEVLGSVVLALFSWKAILVVVEGVALGILVGVMPGLSATLGVALAAPLTFGMDAFTGLLLLVGWPMVLR